MLKNLNSRLVFFSAQTTQTSDAACGWAGCTLAHLEFGSSIKPISLPGGQIMPTTLHTASPSGFDNSEASLQTNDRQPYDRR